MKISKLILSFILSMTLLTQTALAQMASTELLFEQTVIPSSKEKVLQFTVREDVVKILGQMDVNPEMIEKRVSAMTDEEASEIAQKISTLPAGSGDIGSLIGAAVFVFVVLLITDILGFTKVFPFNGPSLKYFGFIIPPVKKTVGISHLAAAKSIPGIILSHELNITIPSNL